MKNIDDLNNDLNGLSDKLIKKLMKAQEKTAQKIKEDVISNLGIAKGKYVNSIKKGETTNEGGIIRTQIYTDLQSNDGYIIGRMIENGTGIYALEPHIGHTKAFFDSQYRYWYVPASEVDRPIGKLILIDGVEFYVAKAQRPKPHWKPALDMNIETYRENVMKVIREEL